MHTDNYKCPAGYDLQFSAIDALRRFVCNGERVWNLFPTSSLTRWDDGGNNEQLFELHAQEQRGGQFCYRLVIEHLPGGRMQVKEETLTAGDSPVFEFFGDEAIWYQCFYGQSMESARLPPSDKHASVLGGFFLHNEDLVKDNLPWRFLYALLCGITSQNR